MQLFTILEALGVVYGSTRELIIEINVLHFSQIKKKQIKGQWLKKKTSRREEDKYLIQHYDSKKDE